MAGRARVIVSGASLESKIAMPAETWREVGTALRLRIIQRTRKGMDADGRTFAPYSDGYRKAKAKQGAPSRVNLTSTDAGGHMLDAIAVETPTGGDVKVRLAFATSEKAKLAHYHMGDGRVDREFFLTSDDDAAAIMALIRKRLKSASPTT